MTAHRGMPPVTRPLRAGAILAAVLVAGSGCGPSAPPSSHPTSAPSASATAAATTGPRLLEDATARFNLAFTHDSGATGQYLMWEQMASGGTFLDADQDGRLDLYLVQCGGTNSASPNRLFHQGPDGRFTDATANSGLDVRGLGMGAIAGDLDNDGLPEIVVTEYGATRLFRNDGRLRFAEITREAGLDNARWATAASFLDFDRDGWLDLVVVNYLDYDPARACRDQTGRPEYCGPQDFPGTVTRLYRNLGPAPPPARGPRFEDVTVRSGLARALGPGLGVLCADFDGDRWPDIFIADDGRPNRLFINRRDGTFAEEAAQRGLAYNAMGAAAGNMGVAPGDLDGDGLFDLFVTHLTHEQHAFWSQGPRGLFRDRVAEVGLVNPRWRGTGFGAVLADLDRDGALDLAIVNGRVLRGEPPAAFLPGLAPLWVPYAQRNQLFLGATGGRFREISESNPDLCAPSVAGVGRALLLGDLDNDGAPDLLVTSTGGPARILRNAAPNPGHWLGLRVVEPARGGRDAIGAEVTVVAGGRAFWRLAQPSTSFLSGHDPRLLFGLDTLARVEAIRVVWPDGQAEEFPGTPADRYLVLAHGTGRSLPDAPTPPAP